MTMERVACCAKPCATCFACSDCCVDGMALHAGQAGPAAGRIADRSRLIGAAAQPRGGGGLRPQLQIMDRTVDGTCEFAKVRGPRCFGGCSELCVGVRELPARARRRNARALTGAPPRDRCCDNRFGVERIFDARLGADPFRHEAAVITRRKPDSFAGFARELFTDVGAASPPPVCRVPAAALLLTSGTRRTCTRSTSPTRATPRSRRRRCWPRWRR